MTEVQATPLNQYVGFDSITRQIETKLLKRGFQFNVSVGLCHLRQRGR
jgi:septin 3/9/12